MYVWKCPFYTEIPFSEAFSLALNLQTDIALTAFYCR